MLPVAWTKGTDFSRAPRLPAREITFFDRFGTTSERGPGPELRFEDGPGAVAEIDIDASTAAVWAVVTDLAVVTGHSTEAIGAEWTGDHRGVGATFTGRNQHPALGTWSVPCFVDAWDERRAFGWRTSDPGNPGARWRFDLHARPGGTRLRYSYTLGPGRSGTTMALEKNPGKEAKVLRRRLDEVRANMVRTVEAVKQQAEAGR